MSYFARVVEERIREAQKEGAFDNLPGKGKPLQLEDQSLIPEDLRMSYHILKTPMSYRQRPRCGKKFIHCKIS